MAKMDYNPSTPFYFWFKKYQDLTAQVEGASDCIGGTAGMCIKLT